MSTLAAIATWSLWTIAVSVAAHLLPAGVFEHDGPITRIRSWERSGRRYARLGVRQWKGHLPDASSLLPGGVDKRRLLGRDHPALELMAAETRRAEVAHWASLALVPVLLVWSSLPTTMAVGAVAILANGPCIVAQRYNRARLERVLGHARSSQPELWRHLPPEVGP